MVVFKHRGNFNNTEKFLKQATRTDYLRILEKYAKEGVAALALATPKDSGETANSWSYKISSSRGAYTISWANSNVVNGVPIAILIQYGHATGNGGYVEGQDYMNPALKPIFDNLANEAWKEVTKI